MWTQKIRSSWVRCYVTRQVVHDVARIVVSSPSGSSSPQTILISHLYSILSSSSSSIHSTSLPSLPTSQQSPQTLPLPSPVICHLLCPVTTLHKMARTRSVLVEAVPMYTMNTSRESRGIVPLVLSQTPDYPAHCLVTIPMELSQFQVFSICITLTICLCVCHVLWTGWGRRAMW